MEYLIDIEWDDKLDNIDWDELSQLYQAASMGNKEPEALKTAFSNSMFTIIVRLQGNIIAAGRCLADGIDSAYIADIAVKPDYQGQGLGRAVLNQLLEPVRNYKKVILYSVPGKEHFYKQFGFKRMSTALAIFETPELALEKGLTNNF